MSANSLQEVKRYPISLKVEKESEIEGERYRDKFSKKITKIIFWEEKKNLASHIKRTHPVLPSVSITPKSMTYRDTA